METKSAIVGGLSALAAVGIAFGGFAVANADTQPAPAPSIVVTTEAPAPVQESAPVVVTPAPEPSTSPGAVPAAPAPAAVPVQEPAYVAEEPAPAPVYVAPEPAPVAPAPVYVAPEPAPQQTFIATNTDAKVPVDSKGYIIGGTVYGPGDGGGKVDMPSK